jgi:hypothetical protein
MPPRRASGVARKVLQLKSLFGDTLIRAKTPFQIGSHAAELSPKKNL